MPSAERGSQKHVQRYVNHYPEILNSKLISTSPSLSALSTGTIEWVSPLAKDDYKEYRDADFLDQLGLGHLADKLSDFWPKKGPSWDALARITTESGSGAIIVEAKAHCGETPYPDQSKAISQTSIKKIDASLIRARKFYGVPDQAKCWRTSHYQVCNRLAHLYFMNEELKVPTWLVWLFVIDDPDWPDSLCESGWLKYINGIIHDIAFPAHHPLKDRIVTVHVRPIEGNAR